MSFVRSHTPKCTDADGCILTDTRFSWQDHATLATISAVITRETLLAQIPQTIDSAQALEHLQARDVLVRTSQDPQPVVLEQQARRRAR